MLHRILVVLICLGALAGCTPGSRRDRSVARSGSATDATGFTVANCGTYRKITVFDPWQKSSNNRFDYYLLTRGQKVPEEIKDKPLFYVPLQRVVCLSTTHIGFLDALGELSSITGISGGAYLTNRTVRSAIEAGGVYEVGYDRGLNYERIVSLKPDVVFAFGVGAEINAQLNKLRDLGIPVVMVGEYLEQTPLGKAEWIKFFGQFYGRERLADSIYTNIRNGYEAIRLKTSKLSVRPAVLTGLPFKDTWWIAGGRSNLAVLINDAGGKFLWSENTSAEAFPVSLEEVFLRASGADFWINCGSVSNLYELRTFDSRFTGLPAVKGLKVYNNNLRSTSGGGNDYWESGVVHPDLLLSDLVKIFHPELSEDKEFSYYKKLE